MKQIKHFHAGFSLQRIKVTNIIIYMKKLLDSGWLRAV